MQNQSDKSFSTHELISPPGPLWPQLIDSHNLWLGWQKVRANAGGAGGDGVRIDTFDRNAAQRVERLAQDLAKGAYQPGPYRTVAIPKKDGGERTLAIPCIVDRVAQTTAAMLASPILEKTFSRSSFAYRPGRGVAQAVQAILRHRRDGYRWAAEGDVERCFDEIPHELLLDKFEKAVGDARLVDLVARWLIGFAPSGIGIPQGSPVSPLLCNLHLDAVDDAIDGSGVRLVRYADDFVILAKTPAKAEAALESMAGQLRMHGLSLNPDKSRLVGSDQALRFLGHVFIRSMAYREVEAEDDPPAPPDAPPEEVLAQWAKAGQSAQEEAAQEAEPRAARLRTLYLVEPGSLLSVRNESFVVLGPEDIDARGNPHRPGRLIEHARRIDRIEIGPRTEADWKALSLAAAHGVPLAMVDAYGATSAWLTGPGDMRGARVAAQARFLADRDCQEKLAIAIVRGRIRNQWLLLRRLNRSRREDHLAVAAVALRRAARALPQQADAATANGHEGNAAKLYWPAYARAIPASFNFDWESWRRLRRPPPDPVNACLGYLAALLERDIRVAIERAGLHPGIGVLHTARDGGDALVYDLMEAFRCGVSETILTTLIGRKVLSPEMFATQAEFGEGGIYRIQCRMELAARRALIQGHESLLSHRIQSRRTGKKILWRALFEEEARALADVFLGEAEDFTPYEIDY